jgi:hypothetical protein
MTWKNPRKMVIRKLSILLPPFIFEIITQVRADSIKSINIAVNQVTLMKIDENRIKEVSQGFYHE